MAPKMKFVGAISRVGRQRRIQLKSLWQKRSKIYDIPFLFDPPPQSVGKFHKYLLTRKASTLLHHRRERFNHPI